MNPGASDVNRPSSANPAATAAGPVLVSGPALVRTAAVRGAVLELTGDTAAATPLEVWAPGRPAWCSGTGGRSR